MRLHLRPAVAFFLCALALPAGVAQARTEVQGSDLKAPANYPYGCETRWMPGFMTGVDEPFTTPPGTCTLMMTSADVKQTSFVPFEGKVLSARIKTGNNPPRMSIVTARRYFKPDSSGALQYTCCRGISETPTFQPAPNTITEVPVNLLVSTRQPEDGHTGWWDLVGLNIHGPGQLPISEIGPHPSNATPQRGAWWLFPKIEPNQDNPSDWMSEGWEVLMQFTWTDCTAAKRSVARAAQACAKKPPPPKNDGGKTGGGDTNPPPVTKAAARVAGKRLTLSGKRVKLKVTCLAATECAGTVRLRTRAKKPKVLARKMIAIPAGKTKTVKLSLSKKSRKRVKKKGLKVAVDIDLGAAGKVTRKLTLKRKG